MIMDVGSRMIIQGMKESGRHDYDKVGDDVGCCE